MCEKKAKELLSWMQKSASAPGAGALKRERAARAAGRNMARRASGEFGRDTEMLK
jgi:hypothetical protein